MARKICYFSLSGNNKSPVNNFQWLTVKELNFILNSIKTLKKYYLDQLKEYGYFKPSINIYIFDINFKGEKMCNTYVMVFKYIKPHIINIIREKKIVEIFK